MEKFQERMRELRKIRSVLRHFQVGGRDLVQFAGRNVFRSERIGSHRFGDLRLLRFPNRLERRV
jgi:hypothetical protein